MRPRIETLDEAIDRVAGSLTALPDDREFAARLDARIGARAASTRGLSLAVASATAALLVAVFMNFDRSPADRVATCPGRVADAEPTSAPTPPLTPMPTPDATTRLKLAERNRGRLEPPPASPTLDALPQIAGLNEPPTLSIDALAFAPVTIEPVTEPGVLELPSLEIRDIDATADQKEQR